MKEQDKWIEFSEGYDDKVFSLTKVPQRREQILERIKKGYVLNMGAGSTSHLNKALVEEGNKVVASDFCQTMLDVAEKEFTHLNLEYILADSRDMRDVFKDETFDAVISVNSILPSERSQVDEMIGEAYRVLKKDGIFVAFLVAFGSPSKLVQKLEVDLNLDYEQKRMRDTTGWQCFHTPKTIKGMMEKAGFQKYDYEKVFLKTKIEIDEMKRLYDIDTRKSFVFEYLLTAYKK